MAQDEADRTRIETLEQYGVMDTPAEPVFDQIVHEAALLTGSPVSTITMVDGKRQWFKAKQGLDHDGDPIADSICAVAMRGDGTFVVEDAGADERFRHMRGVTMGGIRFYAGVPLVVRNGERLGTLCVIDMEKRDGLSNEEERALSQLARRTVAALEVRRDLIADGDAPPSRQQWLDHARDQLEQAAAALTQVGASAALAQLEAVIAMVDETTPGTAA